MISTNRVAGRRVFRLERARRFRRRAGFGVGLLGFVLWTAASPPTAEASWVAMWAKATAQLREGIDLWEKHTRQLEDYMDQASGMVQPFTDLHAGYKELTDLRGIKRLARMGDAYRAEIGNPDCWNVVRANCGIVADFIPTEMRFIDDQGLAILGQSSNVTDGFSFGELEAAIRSTARGNGVGGQWLTEDAPAWVRDSVDLTGDLQRTIARVQYNKARAYRTVRRGQSLASRYQHLGNDVMRVTKATGSGSGLLSTPGQNSRYVRSAVDDSVECNAGSAAMSMVAGIGADPTILAQVIEMDCNGGADASGNPLAALAPGAHQSPTELATVQAGLAIWHAHMTAVELEDEAQRFSNRVAAVEVSVETERRRTQRTHDRVRRAQECPHAPAMYLRCADFDPRPVADIVAHDAAFNGVGMTAREYAESLGGS